MQSLPDTNGGIYQKLTEKLFLCKNKFYVNVKNIFSRRSRQAYARGSTNWSCLMSMVLSTWFSLTKPLQTTRSGKWTTPEISTFWLRSEPCRRFGRVYRELLTRLSHGQMGWHTSFLAANITAIQTKPLIKDSQNEWRKVLLVFHPIWMLQSSLPIRLRSTYLKIQDSGPSHHQIFHLWRVLRNFLMEFLMWCLGSNSIRKFIFLTISNIGG